MDAFDFSRALLTFFDVRDSVVLSAADKHSIYDEMLNSLPPDMLRPQARKTLSILAKHITKARDEHATQKTEPEKARQEPKQGAKRRQ